MAVFPNPSSAAYTSPVKWDIQFKTVVSPFNDVGEEKRRQKWLYPKRAVTLTYKGISKDEAETLWEFYKARKGSYETFAFFESTGQGAPYRSYSSEYVATGDSTTLIFNLPAVDSTQNHDVNLNGAAINSTNYAVTAGGGPDGEDKLTFVQSTAGGLGPPSSTQRITYDFTGRLKVRCRFADDMYSWENFYDSMVNSGIRLQGLLND